MRQFEDQWDGEADISDGVIYSLFFAVGAILTLGALALVRAY